MLSRVCLLLAAGSIVSCSPGVRAQKSAATAAGVPAVDLGRDARLARRIGLRADGVPLGSVVRLLGKTSGPSMTVAGAAGDQMLVAFVPEAPVSEIMSRIAELNRLRWVRGGTPERPTYQLIKAPAAGQQERNLKERAAREFLDALADGRSVPLTAARPGPRDPFMTPLRSLALRSLRERWSQLVEEGVVEIPAAGLSPGDREVLQANLPAWWEDSQAARRESDERLRDFLLSRGDPLPPRLEQAPGPAEPVPALERCRLVHSIRLNGGLVISSTLRAGPAQSTLIRAGLKEVDEAGVELYRDRAIRLAPGEMPPPALPTAPGGTASDLFERPLPPLPEEHRNSPSWNRVLDRLSKAARIAVYSDSFPGPAGADAARTGRLLIPGVAPAELLDRLCGGGRPESVQSFWWRSGDAALVRSRNWLWEADAVIPARVAEQLHRKTGRTSATDPRFQRLGPDGLQLLASLTLPQVQSFLRSSDQLLAWRYAVQIPARLSIASRRLLLDHELTWDAMPPPDRALLAQLLGTGSDFPVSRFAARLRATAWQEGVHLEIHAETTSGRVSLNESLPVPQAEPGRLEVIPHPPAAHAPATRAPALHARWAPFTVMSRPESTGWTAIHRPAKILAHDP